MPQWGDIFGGINTSTEGIRRYLQGKEKRRKHDEQMKIQRLMMEAMGQGRGKFTYGPEKGFGMSVEPTSPQQEAQAEYYRAMAELLKGYTGGMPVTPTGEPTVPVEEPIDLFPEGDRWIYKTIKGIPTRVKAPPKEKTIKEQAIEAIRKGKSLPGMTMEETKKTAGIYIAPKAPRMIPGKVVTEMERAIPKWQKWVPGKQREQKEFMKMRKRYLGQYAPTAPISEIPLKRQYKLGDTKVIEGQIYEYREDGQWHLRE